MKPRSGTEHLGKSQYKGSIHKGGRNTKYHIRFPVDLGDQGGQAGKCECGQMNQAGQTARMKRHPQRTTPNFNSLPCLFLITPGAVASLYFPVWIIRRGGDDMRFTSVRSKISSHLARVFADAGWFGVEVETDNEDFQSCFPTLRLR